MDRAFFFGCHLMLKHHPLLIVFVPISSFQVLVVIPGIVQLTKQEAK